MLKVDVDSSAVAAVRTAALMRNPVSIGLPRRVASAHEFYRYPARFSPMFAAAAIRAFSDVGDLVVDPFVGGGTTAVESRLASRLTFASDLNSLAAFVTTVKTRVHTRADGDDVEAWSEAVARSANRKRRSWPTDPQLTTLFTNFDEEKYAQLRIHLLTGVAELQKLPSRSQALARCALLATAQWALDMRQEVPDVDMFRSALTSTAASMAETAVRVGTHYRAADALVPTSGRHVRVKSIGVPGLADLMGQLELRRPALVLTSPPYPGVYVNYHRWKVGGRRETPLPYFIAGAHDGQGLSYYTMGARADRTLNTYFRRLELAFSDIARICDRGTWLVQVVGFSDPETQLPRYLRTMTRAGFVEVTFAQAATDPDSRLWRDVPGRRWWARAGERAGVAPHTAREVVLFHRRSSD